MELGTGATGRIGRCLTAGLLAESGAVRAWPAGPGRGRDHDAPFQPAPVTRAAVDLLAAKQPVPGARAIDEPGDEPLSCGDAMARVARHLHGGAI